MKPPPSPFYETSGRYTYDDAHKGVHTLADVVRRTGAKRRSVQLWADAGVIKSLPDTFLMGSGVHRLFDERELEIAALVGALAELSISIGALKFFADQIRPILAGVPPDLDPWYITAEDAEKIRNALNRARKDEGANLLIVAHIGERLWLGIGSPASQGGLTIDARTRPIAVARTKGNPMIILDLNDCLRGIHA